MILPPRVPARPHRTAHRARPHEPDWASFVAGTGALLLIAGACLYLVANLAP